MANAETVSPYPGRRLEHPNFRERFGDTMRDIPRWARRHWKSLSLTVAALVAVGGSLWFAHDRGPQNPPQPTTPASDTFPDLGIGVIIPTITPPSIETPTSTIGYQENKDGGLNYVSETGEVLNVPQIPGLRAVLTGTEFGYGQPTVVYNAEPGNPYGLETNAYAGKFNPDVSVENKQTGGVVLTAPVVLKLMGTYTNGLGLPLPLDVSKNQPVSISFTKGTQDLLTTKDGKQEIITFHYTYIVLDLTGEAPLTSIINASQLKILKNVVMKDELGKAYWTCSGDFGMQIAGQVDPTTVQPNILFASNNFAEPAKGLPRKFGSAIDTIQDRRIMVGQGAKNTPEGKLAINDILTTNGVPIFLAANSSPALSANPNQSLDQQFHPRAYTVGGFPRYAPRELPV